VPAADESNHLFINQSVGRNRDYGCEKQDEYEKILNAYVRWGTSHVQLHFLCLVHVSAYAVNENKQ
jgi:hypothetical protein